MGVGEEREGRGGGGGGELFDLVRAEALAEMRKTYDAAVTAWKKESVPYHSYKQYGTIFDRHVKWAEKREVFLGLQK